MTLRELAFEELDEENIVTVAPYQESHQKNWEEFVAHSNNGTIFHTRHFLSYHPKNRFLDHSLLFRKKNKLLSVLPATVQSERSGEVLVSHAGSSMAGPVFKAFTSLKDTFFIVQGLLRYAAENHFKKIKMTLPPLIYHATPGNYFDFALLDSGFTYQKREVSSVIPLNFATEEILTTFSPEARRAARKAIRSGVSVEQSDDFDAFYNILKKNLSMRHNVQPTHSLEELQTLKALYPNDIHLFSARLQDQMIAGVVLFVCNTRVGLAFYISHDEQKQQYRAVNLLFYEVIQWCIRRGLSYLDFGIFTVAMKPNWGLARFKESFGALGVFRDTFIKKI